MNQLASTVQDKYIELFDAVPTIVRSPGRVNIIGEHTDYNNGFVLPAAIDKATYLAIGRRNDDEIHLYSVAFEDYYPTSTKNIQPSDHWSTYVLGVVDQLQKKGIALSGFNLVIDSDIPFGAGLSSSAALECGSIYALQQIFPFPLEKMEMVKMAQAAEHQFAGVHCGIMDQFASMFGSKDYAIRLNCNNLSYEYVPFHLEGTKLVLLNTNVKHSLSSTEYNVRRQQCEQGVAWIKEIYPHVTSLADVDKAMLEKAVYERDAVIYRRCLYVVEENLRLQKACVHLREGNIEALGELMFRTHKGLSEEYEVSCKELDFLVDYVRANPAVLGARMMGGGFGGCTINLIKEEVMEPLVENLTKHYKNATGLELSTYITAIENGTSVVKQAEYERL